MKETENKEKEKKDSPDELGKDDEYDKQMKIVIFGVVFLFAAVAAFYLIYSSITTFDYNGKEFNKVKIGNLMFYKISFPLTGPTGQHVADYNLYLRNDPRTIENIPIVGQISLRNKVYITSRKDFICGDNNIAVANLVQYIEGAEKLSVDSILNTTCFNIQPGTTLIKIENSTENSIKKVGEDCYVLNVNDCAILNVTERFIVGAATL
ncbi:MAG: hypothetical protein AABY22_08920 [Nanoarchaeota archaeon]